jgi:hypothetical protein
MFRCSTVQSNAELVKLLTEITAELTKPEIPGAGKLKAAIPLFIARIFGL